MPAFQKDFEPIVKPGENIAVYGAGGEGKVKYFKVKAIEPLPLFEKDFGAINANSTLLNQEVKDLYVPNGQLAQYRIKLVDAVELTMKQPKSKTKFSTKTGTFKITKDIAGTDFVNLTEFFVYEDQTVLFDVTNPSSSALTNSKVQFAGFKYMLEELTEEPEKYTVISVQAW